MAAPTFTLEERAMRARLGASDDASWLFEAAYLVPSVVLVAFGFAYAATPAFAVAFAIVLSFRLLHLAQQRRSLATVRSVLRKDAEACGADDPPRR